MPNGKAHAIIGATTGAVGSLLFLHEGLNGWEMAVLGAGGATGGYLGAKLPDVFEPAVSPFHRKFAHSIVLNGSVATAEYVGAIKLNHHFNNLVNQIKQNINEAQDQPTKYMWSVLLFFILFCAGFVVGIAAGYLSHIVADSFTPASIPMLGVNF